MSSRLSDAAATLRRLADQLELKGQHVEQLPTGSDFLAAGRHVAEVLPRGNLALVLSWTENGEAVDFIVRNEQYDRLADGPNLAAVVDKTVADLTKPPQTAPEAVCEALPMEF